MKWLVLLLLARLASAQPGPLQRTGILSLPLGSTDYINEAFQRLDFAYSQFQTSAVNQTANYTWTGVHRFNGTLGIPNSAALPGTCTVGSVYQNTAAAAAQQFYLCTATDTWTAQSAAATITGLTADSGGTTTGQPATLTGGAGIATSRAANVVTFVTNSNEANFISTSPVGACGAGTAGKVGNASGKDLTYCDNEGTPVARRLLHTNSSFPSNNLSIFVASDAGVSNAMAESSCTSTTDIATPKITCAQGTSGGQMSMKESAGLGTSSFGFTVAAGTDLAADNLIAVSTAGKVTATALLTGATVDNTLMAATSYGPWTFLDLNEATPANPAAGKARLYGKSGSGACARDSGGTEYCMGGGSGGGGGGIVLGLGTGMKIGTGTSTTYGGLGLPTDPTETIVQMPSPAGVYRNLRCVASATTGGTGIDVVLRQGCGGGADATTLTVTTANVVVTNTSQALTVSAGTCVQVKYVGNALTTAAAVNCSVDFSPVGFLMLGSGSKITAGSGIIFAGPGTVSDPDETIVQMPSPGATFQNLRCAASATTGGTGIVATIRSGTCGALGDSAATVTLTTANTVVSDLTNPVTVTGGQCVSLKLAPGATTTAAAVSCTMERTL